MGDDEALTFTNVVNATNENLTRLVQSVALTASAVLSGSEPSMTNPSAYHKAMSEVVTYKKRMMASRIKENTPKEAIRQSLLRRIGGVRAPELPEELLINLPPARAQHSLFQTFKATAQCTDKQNGDSNSGGFSMRQELAASELMDIDDKIAELRNMRKLVFDRMATVEQEWSSDEPNLQNYYPCGERIRTVCYGEAPIVDLGFNSPFGQLALTRGDKIEVYNLNRQNQKEEGSELDEEYVELKPDGRVQRLSICGSDSVIVAGCQSKILIWQSTSSDVMGNTPTEMNGHIGDVLAISNDESSIVSSSEDFTVREWDEKFAKNIRTIDMFEFGMCRALQHSGSALATGTDDGVVRLWDLRSGSNRPQRELLGGHGGVVSALRFDGLEMISGSGDGSVRVWDLRTSEIVHAEAYAASITSLNLDSTKIVVSVQGEHAVHVLSRTTGEHRLSAVNDGNITVAEYMKGFLVTGRESGCVDLWAV